MIATGRWLFLHLHKSGGTFVNEFLLRFVPGARQVGYHLPYADAPHDCAGLPALAFVRNPWSWYVSWFAFQLARPQPNVLFACLSESGRLDFRATIRRMLDVGADDELLQALVRALPRAYTNRGLNLPGTKLAAISGSGLGFYSFLYRHMTQGAARLLTGRMETLRTDLPRMLAALGDALEPEALRHLQAAPATNVSGHGPYAAWYDDELREIVAQRDSSLIQQFGFRFGE